MTVATTALGRPKLPFTMVYAQDTDGSSMPCVKRPSNKTLHTFTYPAGAGSSRPKNTTKNTFPQIVTYAGGKMPPLQVRG